jgi:hypothetical protein
VFVAEPAGQISGTVLTADGRPLTWHLVDLVAIPPTPEPPSLAVMTDDGGRFVFQALDEGNYLIGVNLLVPPRVGRKGRIGTSPFPATYFPAAGRRNEAEVVHLERGQQLTGKTVRLPPALPQRRINGKVTLDGQPAANATVTLEHSGYQFSADSVNTDANGEFSLLGFQGYDYIIIAQ